MSKKIYSIIFLPFLFSLFLISKYSLAATDEEFTLRYRDFKTVEPDKLPIPQWYGYMGFESRRAFLVQGQNGVEIIEGWMNVVITGDNGKVLIQTPRREKNVEIPYRNILKVTGSELDVFGQYNTGSPSKLTRTEFRNRYFDFDVKEPNSLPIPAWYNSGGVESRRAFLVRTENGLEIVEGWMNVVMPGENGKVLVQTPKREKNVEIPYKNILLVVGKDLGTFGKHNVGEEPKRAAVVAEPEVIPNTAAPSGCGLLGRVMKFLRFKKS